MGDARARIGTCVAAAAIACLVAFAAGAHGKARTLTDPRDISYGGQPTSPPADRPDLDILRVRLHYGDRRALRWTVILAAPLRRPAKHLALSIKDLVDGHHYSFLARGRVLEREIVTKPYTTDHRSLRRVRLERVGKRRYRWTIERRKLFHREQLSFQVVARDGNDTMGYENEGVPGGVGGEEAIDYAPNGNRLNPPRNVKP